MLRHSGLREHRNLIVEAAGALARLEADRLEGMALSCEALSGGLIPAACARNEAIALDASDLLHEMKVFAQILEATRANMNVILGLSESRSITIEYGCGSKKNWMVMETRNGHD